ncbi:hypothetical protein SAMCFNEI73_Ch0530 [Sinorhizobium americanum]|uniref:Uncharacterized protein n=1 Tax=Sinorhizobium americanum TaxID=194963 RepID=A0A1L3LIE0_9HYPH|nr:hypothetical protein SAMCFNEI73_Ch0530 [Sinorhizobium americanum]
MLRSGKNFTTGTFRPTACILDGTPDGTPLMRPQAGAVNLFRDMEPQFARRRPVITDRSPVGIG